MFGEGVGDSDGVLLESQEEGGAPVPRDTDERLSRMCLREKQPLAIIRRKQQTDRRPQPHKPLPVLHPVDDPFLVQPDPCPQITESPPLLLHLQQLPL